MVRVEWKSNPSWLVGKIWGRNVMWKITKSVCVQAKQNGDLSDLKRDHTRGNIVSVGTC